MKKKAAKKNQFNVHVHVDEDIAAQFEKWQRTITGTKGDKLGAALLAVEALFRFNETIVYRLMAAGVTVEKAMSLIREGMMEASTDNQQNTEVGS